MTKSEKVLEVIHDLLRIIAFHSILGECRSADDNAEEARRVLQNSLMEMFVVKWSLLFLNRKGERHRIWVVQPFADRFPAYLEEARLRAEFDTYCQNIFAIRDMYVTHLDDRERVNAAELRWPILQNGKRYLFALRNIVSDEENEELFNSYLAIARAGFANLKS
ncbi:hypothetical protein [Hyphobacterium sp.]|uniref:hypothetical protein n=1 Tax=Hyphobacterium sp. TaxID=2004662 RepID=UPI003B517274